MRLETKNTIFEQVPRSLTPPQQRWKNIQTKVARKGVFVVALHNRKVQMQAELEAQCWLFSELTR